jgi:hypothetical protein
MEPPTPSEEDLQFQEVTQLFMPGVQNELRDAFRLRYGMYQFMADRGFVPSDPVGLVEAGHSMFSDEQWAENNGWTGDANSRNEKFVHAMTGGSASLFAAAKRDIIQVEGERRQVVQQILALATEIHTEETCRVR